MATQEEVPSVGSSAPEPRGPFDAIDDYRSRVSGINSKSFGLLSVGIIDHTARSYNIEGLAHLVLSGCFLAFLPCHYAGQWVKAGRMRALRPDIFGYRSRYEIAWRKSEMPVAATLQFIDCVREVTKAMAGCAGIT